MKENVKSSEIGNLIKDYKESVEEYNKAKLTMDSLSGNLEKLRADIANDPNTLKKCTEDDVMSVYKGLSLYDIRDKYSRRNKYDFMSDLFSIVKNPDNQRILLENIRLVLFEKKWGFPPEVNNDDFSSFVNVLQPDVAKELFTSSVDQQRSFDSLISNPKTLDAFFKKIPPRDMLKIAEEHSKYRYEKIFTSAAFRNLAPELFKKLFDNLSQTYQSQINYHKSGGDSAYHKSNFKSYTGYLSELTKDYEYNLKLESPANMVDRIKDKIIYYGKSGKDIVLPKRNNGDSRSKFKYDAESDTITFKAKDKEGNEIVTQKDNKGNEIVTQKDNKGNIVETKTSPRGKISVKSWEVIEGTNKGTAR
jgi:hypothetical protein